jgi:hypothetical protein
VEDPTHVRKCCSSPNEAPLKEEEEEEEEEEVSGNIRE